MGKLRYLSVLFILLALLSCKKEEVERQEIPEFFNVNYNNPQLSGNMVTIDVRGRVLDFAGNSLSGALVEIGKESTTTDEYGFYEFDQVAVDKSFALIRISGGNHFNQFRNFVPATNRVNTVDVRMVQRQVAGNFQTSSGGVVQLPGGGRVVFDPGTLFKADGSEYSGEVSVYSAYLNPTDPEIARELPGSLAAVESDGELSTLITYGMLAIELESSNGVSLQLADGDRAELKFPIQDEQLSSAPESIELWFFDEASGIWREDGMATIENGEYVGEVSHFTWWNCDVPVPLGYVKGQFKIGDVEYANISNLYFKAVRPNGGVYISAIDPSGFFDGVVPANEELSIYVGQYFCDLNEQLITQGSVAEGDTLDFGELEIPESQLLDIVFIEGQFLDCNNEPITNGIFNYVLSNGMYGSIPTYDQNGSMQFSIVECQGTEIFMQMAAYEQDNEDYVFSSDTLFQMSDGDIDLGEISICNLVIPSNEYFTYSDNYYIHEFGEARSEKYSGCHVLYGNNAQLTEFLNMGFNTPENNISSACLEANLSFLNESGQRVEVHLMGQTGTDIIYQFELFEIGEEVESGDGVTDLYTILGTYNGDASVTVYEDLNSDVVVDSYISPASGEFYHEIDE